MTPWKCSSNRWLGVEPIVGIFQERHHYLGKSMPNGPPNCYKWISSWLYPITTKVEWDSLGSTIWFGLQLGGTHHLPQPLANPGDFPMKSCWLTTEIPWNITWVVPPPSSIVTNSSPSQSSNCFVGITFYLQLLTITGMADNAKYN